MSRRPRTVSAQNTQILHEVALREKQVALRERKKKAKEIASLFRPKYRGKSSQYKFVWPANFFTRCYVLRAKNYFKANEVPWKLILNSMFMNIMPQRKVVMDPKTGKRSITDKTRSSMITSINKWDEVEVVTNFCTAPMAKRAPGAGRTDTIPRDVKVAAYKSLSDISDDPTKHIYFDTIQQSLYDLLESQGFKLFLDNNKKEEYEQKIETKKRLLSPHINNTNSIQPPNANSSSSGHSTEHSRSTHCLPLRFIMHPLLLFLYLMISLTSSHPISLLKEGTSSHPTTASIPTITEYNQCNVFDTIIAIQHVPSFNANLTYYINNNLHQYINTDNYEDAALQFVLSQERKKGNDVSYILDGIDATSSPRPSKRRKTSHPVRISNGDDADDESTDDEDDDLGFNTSSTRNIYNDEEEDDEDVDLNYSLIPDRDMTQQQLLDIIRQQNLLLNRNRNHNNL